MSGNRGIILQARDRELLRGAATMRVIDRNQAMLIGGFTSIGRTNTRLLALVRAGLLRRFFLGSGGGRKAVYAISEKGGLVVDLPCRGPRRPQGALLTVDSFVQHQLSVNDIHCSLAYRPVPIPSVSFHLWRDFYETLSPQLGLIPDGYVEFATKDGLVPCFLEVDLGNESMRIWREKVHRYLNLAVSDDFAVIFQREAFGVLVIATSERRVHSLRKTVAQLTESIFRFTTLEEARDEFFGPVWSKPNDESKQPLFRINP